MPRSIFRAGFSLVETTAALAIFTIVLLTSLALLEHDTHLSRSTLGISSLETTAQEMLFELERELTRANGANPRAVVTAVLPAEQGDELSVDSTLGFPDKGMLLVEGGTPLVERLAYSGLDADQERFLALERGLQCTTSATHAVGSELIWAALAEPIELQDAPPPGTYDGIALEGTQPVHFRGDGTGFSYRVPVDPAQVQGSRPDYLDGDALRWGAELAGTANVDAWMSVQFVPVSAFDEAASKVDVNGDGDRLDRFDVGQLRRRIWSTKGVGAPADDLGLGPSAVLQERCNWGGDLDADGFDDPLFLWDRSTRQLHVRLFVIGQSAQRITVVRRVESVLFLRNEQEL